MNIIKEHNASVFILINAVLWGTSYIWSKMLLGYLPCFTVLFVFSLGGLAALTLLFFRRIRNIDKRTVLVGMGIGVLSIMSNIFCMLALKSTSSSNTAFIVQLSVILTPLIMSALERKMPGGRTIISAFAALAGLLLLTCDFRNFGFNPGDLFALGNAFFFSLYLAALRIYSGKTDPVQFTFMQHIISTFAFLGMALAFELPQINPAGLNPVAVAILLLSTAISVSTILIQSTAIKYVRPEKATVIYTMEPVTAVLFAYVMLGEKLDGIKALTGCMLILFAIVITVWKRRIVPQENDIKTHFNIKRLKAINAKSDG